MEIDPFTFVAQIVNFLVLVLALKFLLFDRIKSVIDTREDEINGRFNEAEKRTGEAEEEKEKYRKRNESFEEEKNELLKEEKNRFETRYDSLIEEAKEEVRRKREKWIRSINEEEESFYRELKKLVGDETISLARQVLGDLANGSLENQVIENFLEKLEKGGLDEETLRMMKDDTAGEFTVKTSFDLSDTVKNRIEQALEGLAGKSPRVEYEESDTLVCGVTLLSGDIKVSWSIDTYLETLKGRFRDMLYIRN